jgi:multiple sugar transport system substrate-binding protein
VTRDGRLVIDDPEVRRKLIQVIDSYTAVYREGCTPPDSVTWDGYGNNKAFLEQTVVMTPNQTLSTVNPLKQERPEDYYDNAVTVDWPKGAYGQPLPLETSVSRAVVFKDGGHVATAKEFVRFLAGEGWLAHYLNFAGERMLPPMPALLQAPFWLDPGDPHRMRSAMQLLTQPRSYNYAVVSGDWRHSKVDQEAVWERAIYRVAAEEITPDQAVDEAIVRIKQFLSE